MFQLSKRRSHINAKTLLIFAVTLGLGLTFNSIFGRYVFRYSIVETFTSSEAEAKLGKRITAKCFEKSGLVKGTVISWQRDFDRQISVKVKFDRPLTEKFDTINFDKKNYRICFGEAGADK